MTIDMLIGSDPLPTLIGGERCAAAADGELLEALNPATGELIARFPRGGAEDVDAAVRGRDARVPGLASADGAGGPRGGACCRLADLVSKHADELAAARRRRQRQPDREMRNDAHIAATQLRYFAGSRARSCAARRSRPATTASTTRCTEPFGVVGRIIPFNHPLMFAAGEDRRAARSPATRSSSSRREHTSLSALRCAELSPRSFPPGVVNVVTGLRRRGRATRSSRTRASGGSRFIGSATIGRPIQRRAADAVVKTVTLELGGKNPIVVFPDADLDARVDGALRGMNFTWQGQSCGSTSRLLVHESIHDEFVEQLGERMDALRIGPARATRRPTPARSSHRSQYDKVLQLPRRSARDEGARVVAGGGPAPSWRAGIFIRPTLFDDVQPDSRAGAGGDLRPGAGGDDRSATTTRRSTSPTASATG